MPRPGKSGRFARAGGTVIADYLPGLWDQHGKGRAAGGGVLDDLFGVSQSRQLRAKDLFNGGSLWREVDQDANFSWKTYEEFLTNQNTCLKDDGVQQSRPRHADDPREQSRQGNGHPDEPVAAMVQRL